MQGGSGMSPGAESAGEGLLGTGEGSADKQVQADVLRCDNDSLKTRHINIFFFFFFKRKWSHQGLQHELEEREREKKKLLIHRSK